MTTESEMRALGSGTSDDGTRIQKEKREAQP